MVAPICEHRAVAALPRRGPGTRRQTERGPPSAQTSGARFGANQARSKVEYGWVALQHATGVGTACLGGIACVGLARQAWRVLLSVVQ